VIERTTDGKGGAINTLLTSAGRRNYLVEYFQEALRGQGKVFAADAKSSAPALQEADGIFLVPPIGHKHYLDALLEFCQQEEIALLIPLNDLELPHLAAARARFAEVGTTVVVSAPEVIGRCFDKWETYRFLRAEGVLTPQTYLSLQDAQEALAQGTLSFPLVLKPRWGSASIGIEFPQDEDELELSYALSQRRLARTALSGIGDPDQALLIQEFVVGDEYGLDIVNDLAGSYVTTFVKQKLGMRAGETDSAVTVAHEPLRALGETLGRSLGHLGNLDCDVFLNEAGAWVLELNPRFGGGYPFSHVAGANLPAALIAWARGEAPDPRWLRPEVGVISSKFSRLMLIRQR
jgi:carbamoyl-phosphate synthase large subunit